VTRSLVRIAHRGGGSLAPENSLEGIELAIGYGVEMVEVDVRRTSDSALVLSHDPAQHGSGLPIAGTTLAALRERGPVLTLDDALDAVRGRVRLNLDIKQPDIAGQLLRTLRDRGANGNTVISCLDTQCLAYFAAEEPAIPRFFSYPPDYGGASTKQWLTPAVNAAVALMRMSMHLRLRGMLRPLPGTGATIYSPLISKRLVALARAMEIDLYTWTVDDEGEMRRLVALGVDGITSNRPDLLASLKREPAPA
jgi:glycerophosphoryl diester phosphodiesterase